MTGGLSGWLCQESSRIINNILVLQSVRHEDKLERFSIIILFNLHACENFCATPTRTERTELLYENGDKELSGTGKRGIMNKNN